MEEIFEIWLRREAELAKNDSYNADIWLRRKAHDRRGELQSAMALLEEFKALPHGLTEESASHVYGLYEAC